MTRLSLAVLLALPVCSRAADVTLTVAAVPDSQGHVLASLCSRADFLSPHCPYQAKAPASPGSVVLHFANVPPGIYAAEAFQDRNDNGVLDKTFFGIPKEPVAFSNNAPMHFGPPRFDAAAFMVGNAPLVSTIDLRTR